MTNRLDSVAETFPLPERLYTARGRERQLGIELEFAGVELERICDIIAALYGGHREAGSRFLQHVAETRWGTFTVEMDTSILKDQSYLKLLEPMGLQDESVRRVEDLLGRAAASLVPMEVACPPVPMRCAGEIERLREALRERRALGTRAALRYAFGLHLNPEAPALDAETVLAYLRAFLLLADLLKVRGRIDLARRIAPFIKEFPQSYIDKVLAPGYAPDISRLIDDYLADNPTRNRPLDLLPLFAMIDRDRVEAPLSHQAALIKPRPAFHYRLPNCRIDEPQWRIADEWRGWLWIEMLAQRPALIERLAAEYLQLHRSRMLGPDPVWAARVEQVLA